MENNNTQANPVKVLQIGMTKNIGGLETYLMQQFDHMDHAKVMYDFVNITAEDDIVFHDKIEKQGAKFSALCPGIVDQSATTGSGINC